METVYSQHSQHRGSLQPVKRVVVLPCPSPCQIRHYFNWTAEPTPVLGHGGDAFINSFGSNPTLLAQHHPNHEQGGKLVDEQA